LTSADDARLDPSVAARLFDEHGGELLRLLSVVLRDVELASDCLQAAFAKAIESGGATEPATRRNWLFRVAMNEALQWKRKAAAGERATRKKATRRLAGGQATVGDDGRADAALVRRETINRVRAAMAKLSAAERTIVEMRIDQDKTFAQIAQELNVPLGTVLWRMRTAAGRLRACLKDDELK
jgi:RNA polymerase sigma-70 factor (ECF subfamily)